MQDKQDVLENREGTDEPLVQTETEAQKPHKVKMTTVAIAGVFMLILALLLYFQWYLPIYMPRVTYEQGDILMEGLESAIALDFMGKDTEVKVSLSSIQYQENFLSSYGTLRPENEKQEVLSGNMAFKKYLPLYLYELEFPVTISIPEYQMESEVQVSAQLSIQAFSQLGYARIESITYVGDIGEVQSGVWEEKIQAEASSQEALAFQSSVKIDTATILRDEEKAKIVLSYLWKNSEENAETADNRISARAYQDGIELDSTGYIEYDYAREYDTNAGTRKVKPGVSIAIDKVFVLRNTTTPVVYELTPRLSLSDKPPMVKETFAMTDGDQVKATTNQPPARPSSATNILPSDQRYITRDDISWMDRGTVVLARNEIYARHGCTFQDDRIRQYFESQDWYFPIEGNIAINFSTSNFNTYEKENLNTIIAYEKEMGWRA